MKGKKPFDWTKEQTEQRSNRQKMFADLKHLTKGFQTEPIKAVKTGKRQQFNKGLGACGSAQKLRQIAGGIFQQTRSSKGKDPISYL